MKLQRRTRWAIATLAVAAAIGVGICLVWPSTHRMHRRPQPVLPGAPVARSLEINTPVEAVAFSPDGKTLAAGGGKMGEEGKPGEAGKVWLWDGRTFRFKSVFTVYTGLAALAFSPDGKTLATGGPEVEQPAQARLWSHRMEQWNRLVTRVEEPDKAVESWLSGMRPLERQATEPPGEVRLWDVSGSHLKSLLRGYTDLLETLAFAPDGKLLAGASDDGTARLWDVATGKLARTLSGQQDAVRSAVFSPDGSFVVTASGDGTAWLWGAATGKLAATFKGHRGSLWAAVFSPDGRLFATASGDGDVRVWDVETGKLHTILRGPAEGMLAAAFSPDGRVLAAAGADGTARLWTIEKVQPPVVLEGHTGPVWIVRFAPDGRTLATGSADGMVRLWSLPDGRLVSTLDGGGIWITSLAFAPDSKHLVTGSVDYRKGTGEVRVWNVPASPATPGQPR